MSISINRYANAYNQYGAPNITNQSGGSASPIPGSNSLQEAYRNSDGDSFQLSSQMNGGLMDTTYSMADGSQGSNDDPLGINSLLEKIKNGTVTSDDIAAMQAALSQAPLANSDDSSGDASMNDPLGINDLLTKIKNGTVTDSDIEAMQQALNQGQQGDGSDSSNIDPLGIEAKIKSGSLTAEDLAAYQQQLNNTGNS